MITIQKNKENKILSNTLPFHPSLYNLENSIIQVRLAHTLTGTDPTGDFDVTGWLHDVTPADDDDDDGVNFDVEPTEVDSIDDIDASCEEIGIEILHFSHQTRRIPRFILNPSIIPWSNFPWGKEVWVPWELDVGNNDDEGFDVDNNDDDDKDELARDESATEEDDEVVEDELSLLLILLLLVVVVAVVVVVVEVLSLFLLLTLLLLLHDDGNNVKDGKEDKEEIKSSLWWVGKVFTKQALAEDGSI